MATKTWEITKIATCERLGREIALEAEVVYPADFLPDSPRILTHRCSSAKECNLLDKPACAWAATNPDYLPL